MYNLNVDLMHAYLKVNSIGLYDNEELIRLHSENQNIPIEKTRI